MKIFTYSHRHSRSAYPGLAMAGKFGPLPMTTLRTNARVSRALIQDQFIYETHMDKETLSNNNGS